jgi:hypothetical protein
MWHRVDVGGMQQRMCPMGRVNAPHDNVASQPDLYRIVMESRNFSLTGSAALRVLLLARSPVDGFDDAALGIEGHAQLSGLVPRCLGHGCTNRCRRRS